MYIAEDPYRRVKVKIILSHLTRKRNRQKCLCTRNAMTSGGFVVVVIILESQMAASWVASSVQILCDIIRIK